MVNDDFHAYAALAIIVLKSKPSGISVEDYIVALRSSLLPSNNNTSTSRLINSTALWERLFHSSQRSNLDLQAELTAIRAEKDDCAAQDTTSQIQQKRKKSNANTQLKRRKLDPLNVFNVEPKPLAFAPHHKDRTLLLRTMYGLGRQPLGAPERDDGLTHLICLSCEVMLEALQNCKDDTTNISPNPDSPLTLREACISTKRVWSLLVQRLGFIEDVDVSMIAPQLAALVETLLTRLFLYCETEAAAEHQLRSATERARLKVKSDTGTHEAVKGQSLFKHNCDNLSSTIGHILYSSHAFQLDYPQLFDAITAAFLQKLGVAMSIVLFDQEKELFITIKNTLHTTIRYVEVIKLQTPHFVAALKALMHRNDLNRDNTNAVTKQVVDRLQQQLLCGIFGKDYKAVASSPTVIDNPNTDVSAQLYQAEGDPEDNEADLLISEVWEILGWDILFASESVSANNVPTNA